MCTVTFVPRPTGFLLAMNRDESRSRPVGLPPIIVTTNGRKMLGPQEAGGGSWLRVNDGGITCALLNWYGVVQQNVNTPISRGTILNEVAQQDSATAAIKKLRTLELKRVRPFRLLVFDKFCESISEVRWNQKRLSNKTHSWELTRWASSGYDEPAAQRARKAVLNSKLKLAGCRTINWVRQLHRSHLPEKGALSTCMHREDAATVSYTELAVQQRQASMRHFNHAPCELKSARTFHATALKFNS